jgi:hypothetical protein
MNFKGFFIGPFGLTVAVITVLAFIALMLLHALAGSGRSVPAGGPAASHGTHSAHAGSTRGLSLLRRLASARWVLAAVTIAITSYRIYSLS